MATSSYDTNSPFLQFYCVWVIFLSGGPDPKPAPAAKKIWIDRSSKFEDVKRALPEGWTLLRASYDSPSPSWTQPSESTLQEKIGFPCLNLYAVNTQGGIPYVLGVVRTSTSDYPIAIYENTFKSIIELVVESDPRLKGTNPVITGYSSPEDVSTLKYAELVKKEVTSPVVFIVYLSKPPEKFQFDVNLSSIPPFLQILFVNSKEFMQQAYSLRDYPLQMIHLSGALFHAIVSLSEASETSKPKAMSDQATDDAGLGDDRNGEEFEVSDTGYLEEDRQAILLLADDLQKRLKDLKGILGDIQNNPFDPVIQRKIDNIIIHLCGDYPGAVTIRHSRKTFEKLKAIDQDEIHDKRRRLDQEQIRRTSKPAENTVSRLGRIIQRVGRVFSAKKADPAGVPPPNENHASLVGGGISGNPPGVSGTSSGQTHLETIADIPTGVLHARSPVRNPDISKEEMIREAFNERQGKADLPSGSTPVQTLIVELPKTEPKSPSPEPSQSAKNQPLQTARRHTPPKGFEIGQVASTQAGDGPSNVRPISARPRSTSGPKKGLCLLSLDAGGSQAISQLKILSELMHGLNFGANENENQRPRDAFDMIGGAGSGGFVAILLVKLGLDAQKALDEFIDLSINILDAQGMDAWARTAALEKYIDGLLEKYGIEGNRRLLDSGEHSETCKLVVPISYKSNADASCILRNFETLQEEATNLTIAQALSATIAIPPLFTSTSIINDFATFEYTNEDLKMSNPTQKVISEAYHAFGPEGQVACLLSIGCGHTGVVAAPEDSDHASWDQFLEKLITNSEQQAGRIDNQIGHLGIYHRLRVAQGLQSSDSQTRLTPGDIVAHTTAHLSYSSVSRNVELCTNSLKIRDGAASLVQLKHSGGQALLPIPRPTLTKTFVMRRKPFEFIEKVMLGYKDTDDPRLLVVTGIGGCGKTQLILKFMRVHEAKFGSTFFIDGSSESRIRADIFRHVRSLGTAHSHKSFKECLLFLSQPTPDRPRLIVYDNVDAPELDLFPLLPQSDSSAVIITSRNRSIGALSPQSHLELDKMTTEEAVELLLSIEPDSHSITEQARSDARAIAEALGCLPIALRQACSYMYHSKCSRPAYLERLSDSQDKLLAQPVKYQREMRYLSTYAAFNASFEKLPLREQKMLRLLSFLHWSKFPLELIILAAKHKFSEYGQWLADDGEQLLVGKALLEEIFFVDGTWNAASLDELMVSLQSHSLVNLIAGVDTMLLEMHPLLHGWLRSSVPQQEKPRYQAASVLLVALGHRNDYTVSTQYLASHVAHLSHLWDQLHINNRAAFGLIMRDSGLYVEGILLLEGVVRSLKETTDPQSLSLLNSVSLLAHAYSGAGRLKEAMALQEEVLKLSKEALGDRHPATIMASSNLAFTYRDLGRLKGAEALQVEVLRLRKEVLGDHHPDTVMASRNLAFTYRDLGRLKEAEALQVEVLRLRKEVLGDHHPDTIMASSNLALTYRDLGRLNEAEALQVEVLELRKRILGKHHPDTITASSNLANTYYNLGQLKEAEVLQIEVMNLRKMILGERHPGTCRAMLNLAQTYEDLEKHSQAAGLLSSAEVIILETLGTSHPLYPHSQEVKSYLARPSKPSMERRFFHLLRKPFS